MTFMQSPLHKRSAPFQANTLLRKYAIFALGILLAAVPFAFISVFPFRESIPQAFQVATAIVGLALLGLAYRNQDIFKMYLVFLAFGTALGFTTIGII